jgi:hypothetical protein
MSNQTKVGRVRVFRFTKDGKTELKVHVDFEDGTTIEGKAFENVSGNQTKYWAGNMYKVEAKPTVGNSQDVDF